jgi:4-amino-4-deoxy-L-arabinose transferase-like glycosyltransferase
VDRFFIIAMAIAVALALTLISFPDGAAALLVVLTGSLIFLAIFRHFAEDKDFVTNLFLIALLLRLGFGILVHTLDLREFFGGDADTYDYRGFILMKSWLGQVPVTDPMVQSSASISTPGWGIHYFVAALYMVIGRNIFAAQSLCAVVGAATAPMVYFCSHKIFRNLNVAKFAAVGVAIFPSFIIWSGQLLKDGLIVFLLVLAVTMVLQLQERLNWFSIALLMFSLAGILALRFYIFYMVGIAVAGSFLVGTTNSGRSVLRRIAILVLLGLGLTYFGVTRTATVNLERFTDLEQVQRSRLDLSQSAKSGFSEDVDVSTTQGAINAIPIGFSYLMFAPFPWEASNLRQAITIPEVLVWWTMIPIMIYGIWWSIRHRLRNTLPVLIFSLMLTLAYSIFLGNVGTAYRQRTQIQVFLFMFIAVGIELYRESKENKRLKRRARL